VFILMCKDKRPAGIPPLNIPELRYSPPDRSVRIRVDINVVHEADTGNAKSDENTSRARR
jgi:hypothetical protein